MFWIGFLGSFVIWFLAFCAVLIVIGGKDKPTKIRVSIIDDSKRGEAVRVFLIEDGNEPRHIATLPACSAFNLEILCQELGAEVERKDV